MSRSPLSFSSPSTGSAKSHVEGCAEGCAKAVIVWEVVREAVWKARRFICLEFSLFTQHAHCLNTHDLCVELCLSFIQTYRYNT